MRSSLKTLIAVAAALLVVPSLASAGEVGDGNDLQEVLSRMADLEQQLQATNDALAASNARVDQQQKMLSKFETTNQSGSMLALSNFLSETTFAGWVSASYFYNTNNPDSGRNQGANAGTIGANPYHSNHNSFQVDQVWFSMSNEATPESRGGFAIDIVYGEAADRLAMGLEGNSIFDYLFNANVSYLAPITNAGIKITAGRFEKHIGSEYTQDPYNFNITRGMLYTLQPINFTGLKISTMYESGIHWMVGATNNSGYATFDVNPYGLGQNARNYDTDDEKALIWTLGYKASDALSLAFNGLYGGDCATGSPTLGGLSGEGGRCGRTFDGNRFDAADNDRQVLFDVTMNWDPSDRLSTWVNFDYMYPTNEGRTGNPRAIGVAAAGRLGLTDATGVALRLEYIHSKDNYLGLATPIFNPATILVDATAPGAFPNGLASNNENAQLWSVTATLDHALTEHLAVKAEVVYQEGDSDQGTDKVYFCGNSCTSNAINDELKRRQILVGAQMTYEF